MAKPWKPDRPRDEGSKLDGCVRAGFSLQQCSQAMAQIGALLRDTLREKRVTPEDVMNAMLPALQGAKKIEITEAAVRAAVRKILDAE